MIPKNIKLKLNNKTFLSLPALFGKNHNIQTTKISVKVSNKNKIVNAFFNFLFAFWYIFEESKKKLSNIISLIFHSIIINSSFIVEKIVKVSHYPQRGFSTFWVFPERKLRHFTLRVISFFGECLRFVSQKINFQTKSHRNYATLLPNKRIENLTNYAEAILHYLSKHFSKESDALTPEHILSVAGNQVCKKRMPALPLKVMQTSSFCSTGLLQV